MFAFVLLYFFTCFVWMIYALLFQLKFYPESGSIRLILCGILNYILCPICIIISILSFNRDIRR